MVIETMLQGWSSSSFGKDRKTIPVKSDNDREVKERNFKHVSTLADQGRGKLNLSESQSSYLAALGHSREARYVSP